MVYLLSLQVQDRSTAPWKLIMYSSLNPGFTGSPGVAYSDVDDRRLGPRAQLLEEQRELASPVPERSAGGETREHAQVIAAPR